MIPVRFPRPDEVTLSAINQAGRAMADYLLKSNHLLDRYGVMPGRLTQEKAEDFVMDVAADTPMFGPVDDAYHAQLLKAGIAADDDAVKDSDAYYDAYEKLQQAAARAMRRAWYARDTVKKLTT